MTKPSSPSSKRATPQPRAPEFPTDEAAQEEEILIPGFWLLSLLADISSASASTSQPPHEKELPTPRSHSQPPSP